MQAYMVGIKMCNGSSCWLCTVKIHSFKGQECTGFGIVHL